MYKRFLAITMTFIILFLTAIGRVGYISLSKTYTVSDGYNSYLMTIDCNYPTLYYSDFTKINNNSYEYVAIIRQDEKNVGELNKLFSYDEINDILEELKNGYPVFRNVDYTSIDKVKYIKIVKITTDNDSDNLSQLLSTNSSGLLKYMNNNFASRKIKYSTDATGRFLSGDYGEIIDNNYDSSYGLKLTINKDIQEIAYKCSKTIDSGAIVIMDVKTSKILACVNKPNETYINKCFSQYAIGSVFKLVVAASALENNCDIEYCCTGKIVVGDTTFSCQNNNIHSNETLKTALANSCNCYFVNLALTLGKEKIYKTAQSMGFNKTIKLYDEWYVDTSYLPSIENLNSKGQLALFGFGQGELLATPLQLCNSLCVIANNGYYTPASLVSDIVNEDLTLNNYNDNEKTKVLSQSTCDKLIEYMRYTVTNGTAKSAETNEHLSAGKTATAQTGQYYNGKETLNTWFAGVYPYNNPKYAIVILNENGTSGAGDCCPIFRSVVEMLK